MKVAHPQSGSLSTRFVVELEFRNVPWGKPLGAKERPNNKLNPHMASMRGTKPGPHWWETSAFTNALPLVIWFFKWIIKQVLDSAFVCYPPQLIIPTEICIILQVIRKPNPIIANYSNLLYSPFWGRQFVKWSALGHVMTTRLHSYHFIFTGHTETTLSKHECMNVWIWVADALQYEQRICFKHCKRKAFDWSLSLASFLCR